MKGCYFTSTILTIALAVVVSLLWKKPNTEYVKIASTETVSNKPVTADVTPLLTYAKEALSKNEVQTAGLYFGSALKQAQGELSVLYQYHQSMQDYAMQLGKTEPENAIRLLAEIGAFLRAQAVYLNQSEDLKRIQKVFDDLEKHKQDLLPMLAEKTLKQKQQLISASDVLLTAKPDTVSVTNLEKTLLGLRDLNTESLSAEDKNSVLKKIEGLEQFSAATEKEATKKHSLAVIRELFDRANSFIEKALKEPEKSNFTLYYLNSVDAILRQAILAESEINDDSTKTALTKLFERLEQAKLEISEKQSQVVWKKIQDKLDEFNAFDKKYKANPTHFKEQDGIDAINGLYTVIAENMNYLTSDNYIRKARELLQDTNKVSTQWQESQKRKYESSMLEQMKVFNGRAASRLKTITSNDTDGLYYDILGYLAPIDTRLLSFATSTTYQEVFGKFYAKLPDELKIRVSSDIVLADKKKLSDF